MPARIATPPIDGVPRLVWWLGGPSSRISWPKPCRLNSRISIGVSRIETVSEIATARRMSIIAYRPGRRVGRLDQHHVPRLQLSPQQGQGVVGVDEDGGFPAPRALHDRAVVHGAHRPPRSDDNESRHI